MHNPAKILAAQEVLKLLSRVDARPLAERNTAIVLLSFKAGLRAAEIAGLDWSMVTSASGAIGDSLAISGSIAKNGRARRVPLHSKLRSALVRLSCKSGRPRTGPVIRSQRGGHMTPGSVVNWFTALYADVGLQGCSSHSGRRTFITNSARLVAKVGGCLRDVQELAGHSSILTTQLYIMGDRDSQRWLGKTAQRDR